MCARREQQGRAEALQERADAAAAAARDAEAARDALRREAEAARGAAAGAEQLRAGDADALRRECATLRAHVDELSAQLAAPAAADERRAAGGGGPDDREALMEELKQVR